MAKYQKFNGVYFYEEKERGYYRNSKLKDRMHRYVWRFYNGEIPEGYHVHHIDGNKGNNDIKNLELIYGSDHLSMHGKMYFENNKEKVRKNLKENAIPKASEWHKSEEGRKFHRELFKKGLSDFIENKVIKECIQCGKEYETINTEKPKFCSNKCKSKHRRESGVDDVTKSCENCGSSFVTNKYYKKETCSLSCTKELRR